MPTVTLRPRKLLSFSYGTGGISNTYWYPEPSTTTDANKFTLLKDDLDTTWIKSVTDPGTTSLVVLVDGYDLAGQTIMGIVPRIRCKKIGAANRNITWRLRRRNGDNFTNVTSPGTTVLLTDLVIRTYSGSSQSTEGDGTAWQQSDLGMPGETGNDTVHVFIEAEANVELREVYLDVIFNSAPVLSEVGPVDEDTGVAGVQVLSSSRPTIGYTYFDADGNAQERRRAKIFTPAQYDAVGFAPETSAAYWDSGEVFSSDHGFAPGVDLGNGQTYRAYVKAGDVGSGSRYGAWAAGPSFTMSLGPVIPPVPTLSASSSAGRVTLTARSTGTPNVEFMRFEYQLSDGTWGEVRGAGRVPATSGADAVAYDYEAVPNVATSYRAFAGRVNSGSDVFSAASITRTATVTITEWTLVDFAGGTRMDITLSAPPVFSSEERSAEFLPIGRKHPVTLADTVGGEQTTLSLVFLTHAAYQSFEAMRKLQRTLLLQDPQGQSEARQWYIRLGAVRASAMVNTQTRGAITWRVVSIDASERARP